MLEHHRILDYCEHYYISQLKDSRVGLKLAVIGYGLFVYADLFVFNYPIVITIFRIILMLVYGFALCATYIFENKRKLLKVIISISTFLALAFGSFNSIYISMVMPDYFYRASEVFILIVIGSVLFSGIIKPYLHYLIGVNILVYIIITFIVNGFNVMILFQNLNIIFLSGTIIIFNYLYIRSRVYEYEAVEDKNRRIDELKSEIEVRQELQYQLKEMATYDGLTNAYTRAIGLGMLDKQMNKSSKEYKSLSIIYLDVNGLKVINDTYGHKTGDVYIVGLVEIINRVIRPNDFCIRLGGDEFLLVLPNTTYYEAERLWRVINDEIVSFDISRIKSTIPLTVSHGLAEYNNKNYASIEYFLDAADDNMYKEKKIVKKTKVNTIKEV